MYSSPESQNENTYKYLMVGFFYGIKNMKQKAVELKHIFFVHTMLSCKGRFVMLLSIVLPDLKSMI